MSPKNKIMVGGFSGGGKSTLFRLLDGHPKIVGTQVHERFMRLFYSTGRRDIYDRSGSETLRTKTASLALELKLEDDVFKVKLSTLRSLLAKHTAYYQIEDDAEQAATYTGAGSNDFSLMTFDFDFVGFERRWKQTLFREPGVKTPEIIIDALYRAFFESWRNYHVQYEDADWLAFCLSESPQEIRLAIDNGFAGRVIYIDRALKGTIATRILRLGNSGAPVARGFKSHKDYVLNSGIVQRSARWKAEVHELARRHPDKILVMDFEDLILRTEPAMRRLCEYVGLSFEPVLLEPTHLGRLVPDAGRYLGRINDRWEDVLNAQEAQYLDYLEPQARRAIPPMSVLFRSVRSHLINTTRKVERRLARG